MEKSGKGVYDLHKITKNYIEVKVLPSLKKRLVAWAVTEDSSDW